MTGRPMTEKEAVEVWCPWSIGLAVAHDDRTLKTANRQRGGDYPPGCACLASRCAAWIWQDPPELRKDMVPRGRVKAAPVKGDVLPPRPNGVPRSWEVEADEGDWYWYEDDDAYERRFKELEEIYPENRRGGCGNVKGDNSLQGVMLQLGGR